MLVQSLKPFIHAMSLICSTEDILEHVTALGQSGCTAAVESHTTAADDVNPTKRVRSLPYVEPAALNLETAQVCTFVASENIPPTESANVAADLTQRARSAPLPDPRAWSAALDSTDRCSIFTIRAFLGDPDIQLPARIKALRKSDLQSMMQRCGFVDISGGKDALLHRFQTGIPFLEYRIDGRECLQRMLVVSLDSWGCDDSHCFRATLPARGDCPWGAKRLRDLDSLCEVPIMFASQNFLSSMLDQRWREKWIKGKLKNQRYLGAEVDRATLEAVLDRRVSLDDPAPYRTVDGIGFEPGPICKGWDRHFSNDVGGALSLNECALAVGDRISMSYDFGASKTITFKIIKVDRNEQELPEVTVMNRHATRANVDQRGGAGVMHSVREIDYDEEDE